MDDLDTRVTVAPSGRNFQTDSLDMMKTIPCTVKIGERLSNERYIVEELLGEGAMGQVFRCTDTFSKTDVAIKIVPPALTGNSDALEDILHNYQLVEKLRHTNIAALKTLEPDTSRNNSYLLVMEYVKGKSLQRMMLERRRNDQPFSPDEVKKIISQIASALDYAHQQKIVHRDIKPGNIMITDDLTVTVLDFGLAARIRTTMSVMSVPIDNSSGTPAYKSPEQWKSVPSKAASDQYSLAVLAHEMLTGYLPFENDDLGVLRESVIHIAPERPDDISDQAWSALQKALSKAPAERFESCTAFVNALFSEAKAPERKIEQPAPKPEPEPVPGDKFVFAETGNTQDTSASPFKIWLKSFYKGRASRKEYWFYQLRWWLCNFFLTSIFAFICMRSEVLFWRDLYFASLCWGTGGLILLTLPSWTGIAIRRLHDFGESGRKLYWIFLPVIGWGKLLYDCCNYSTPGTNQYGKTKEFSFKKLYSPWFFGIVTFLFVLMPSTRLLAQRALCECGIISTVSIPSGIVYMPHEMFDGCTNLTSVNIPNSVTEIGSWAFRDCTGLTSVNIPNSVREIEASAFSGCTNLTSVNIPDSVREIGRWAFSGCTGLTSVNIPNSVREIDNGAFDGCTGLTSVNIPNSVREIRRSAFSGCTGLTSVNIPNSVTKIGRDAFKGCTNLIHVSIPQNCEAWGAFPDDCKVVFRRD